MCVHSTKKSVGGQNERLRASGRATKLCSTHLKRFNLIISKELVVFTLCESHSSDNRCYFPRFDFCLSFDFAGAGAKRMSDSKCRAAAVDL